MILALEVLIASTNMRAESKIPPGVLITKVKISAGEADLSLKQSSLYSEGSSIVLVKYAVVWFLSEMIGT
jgi:hypothetical protein